MKSLLLVTNAAGMRRMLEAWSATLMPVVDHGPQKLDDLPPEPGAVRIIADRGCPDPISWLRWAKPLPHILAYEALEVRGAQERWVHCCALGAWNYQVVPLRGCDEEGGYAVPHFRLWFKAGYAEVEDYFLLGKEFSLYLYFLPEVAAEVEEFYKFLAKAGGVEGLVGDSPRRQIQIAKEAIA